ncbi:hypothetical protein BJ973_005337 [Actinoplanes tereljensis]|uniref:Uncharacterized protein n=1 Tax=Paractinoplanes tereljensis TaxID=571912 RepID=A0A919TTF3_9ACTN|nr:hypothetical protein [Actinoplanes tereljensis]GIF21214.1 hypothetical protein Ate02nite_39440 [Actinoplanes tereljensis]
MVDRGAVMRVLSGLAVVAAAVLVLGIIWATRREAVPPGGDPGDVVRVGVVQGQTVGGYLHSSATELAALSDPSAPASGDTWALVSLTDYVPPGALGPLFEGAAVAQVYARVPIAGAHTQVVRIPVFRLSSDVLAGMLDAALQRDQEQAEYEQLGRRLGGDDANRRARAAYESAARTARNEADAYRSGCACVFAAVVRAAPAALQAVAARTGVRSVDPAPEVRELERAEFRPPQPEQEGTIPAEPSGSPIPVPNGGSAIASRTPAPIISSSGAPVTSNSPAVSDPSPDSSATAPEERTAVPSATDVSAAQGVPSP